MKTEKRKCSYVTVFSEKALRHLNKISWMANNVTTNRQKDFIIEQLQMHW